MLAAGSVHRRGCPHRRRHDGQARRDELQPAEQHAERRRKHQEGRDVLRGYQLHDPAGLVRPHRHHHHRSPVLPDPSRAPEEAGPEEEVRPAVQLRRLRGDGGGGQRRGRHPVRSSQPAQMSSAAPGRTDRSRRRLTVLIQDELEEDGNGPKTPSCLEKQSRIINILSICSERRFLERADAFPPEAKCFSSSLDFHLDYSRFPVFVCFGLILCFNYWELPAGRRRASRGQQRSALLVDFNPPSCSDHTQCLETCLY